MVDSRRSRELPLFVFVLFKQRRRHATVGHGVSLWTTLSPSVGFLSEAREQPELVSSRVFDLISPAALTVRARSLIWYLCSKISGYFHRSFILGRIKMKSRTDTASDTSRLQRGKEIRSPRAHHRWEDAENGSPFLLATKSTM